MKYLTQNKHWDIVEDYNLDKLLYLLIDRPDCINPHMRMFWLKKNTGYEYRDYDLPTSFSFGDLFWDNNDERKYNKNKPRQIWFNGKKIYYNKLCK